MAPRPGVGVMVGAQPITNACELCGQSHVTLAYQIGDRVRLLSMMPHRLEKLWFHGPGQPLDRSGQVGVVVKAQDWPLIGRTAYIVNFNPDPLGPWIDEPAQECQLEIADETIDPLADLFP